MGRGGMRWGAGRPGYRVKAEQLHRVDVRVWARGGYLQGVNAFTWSWNRGGERTGSIGVHVHAPDVLTLLYTITQNDQAREVVERLTIANTSCPFGGSRPWFQCPRCARRVAVLYMRQGRFACRHCQRVAYSSQSEDELGRMWRKQGKIEARLGENWRRPKGMRQRTYDHLFGQLLECEERRDRRLALLMGRLMDVF